MRETNHERKHEEALFSWPTQVVQILWCVWTSNSWSQSPECSWTNKYSHQVIAYGPKDSRNTVITLFLAKKNQHKNVSWCSHALFSSITSEEWSSDNLTNVQNPHSFRVPWQVAVWANNVPDNAFDRHFLIGFRPYLKNRETTVVFRELMIKFR
jgi:hypothetical protein